MILGVAVGDMDEVEDSFITFIHVLVEGRYHLPERRRVRRCSPPLKPSHAAALEGVVDYSGEPSSRKFLICSMNQRHTRCSPTPGAIICASL